MNYKTSLITLGLAVAFLPSSVSAFSGHNSQKKSDSQPVKITKRTNNHSFSSSFKPPNKGQPKYTVGGATRGNTCAIDQENKSEVTALVPEKDQSLTLQSHPSFFAYVSPLNGEKLATFIVKDQTEDYYHSQQLTLPASGGIVKMTLAKDAPELEVGKNYTWFLRIQCNAVLEPEDPLISASVTRIENSSPDINQNDLISFYASSQVWYDSLNTAFKLSQSGDDIYWSELLNNIGMDRFIAR